MASKQSKLYFLLFGYILLLPYRFPSPPIDIHVILCYHLFTSPLKITKINFHGVSDSALFRDHLKVRLSPLKSSVRRNSRSKYRRSVVYPSISKCNAKRCSCCKHLCCKSIIKSNVNGRQFSAITNSDLD